MREEGRLTGWGRGRGVGAIMAPRSRPSSSTPQQRSREQRNAGAVAGRLVRCLPHRLLTPALRAHSAPLLERQANAECAAVLSAAELRCLLQAGLARTGWGGRAAPRRSRSRPTWAAQADRSAHGAPQVRAQAAPPQQPCSEGEPAGVGRSSSSHSRAWRRTEGEDRALEGLRQGRAATDGGHGWNSTSGVPRCESRQRKSSWSSRHRQAVAGRQSWARRGSCP